MIFNIRRSLENKVFSTALVRVAEQDDPCAEIESKLENDFGPVEIEAGGKFEAYVSKSDNSKPSFSKTATEAPGEFLFKFALDTNIVQLTPNVVIPYSCDSNKETPRKDTANKIISPLEIAELKCKIFESIIKDRISTAVDEWKAKQTDFESETVPAFEKHLC